MIKKILSVLIFNIFLLAQADFLEPKDAFVPSVLVTENQNITVKIKLGEGIYLYKESIEYSFEGLDGIEVERVNMSPTADHGGKQVFKDLAEIDIVLQNSAIYKTALFGNLNLSYQGCAEDGLCYEPVERSFPLTIDTAKMADFKNAAPIQNEADSFSALLEGSSFAYVLLSFFGFGLLLSLTPCVFPMIPILSSIIVSQKEGMSAKRGFYLSLVYVISVSLTYALAGIAAGLFGSNIQAAMQNQWVIYAFAGLFVALALSLFGFYEIRLPHSIQNRINGYSTKAGNQKNIIGVAVMGLLSALIVGPCVAPPLAGALIYIGQTGNAILGGMALFVFSMGMGMPLLAIGTGAGRFMPRPGGWMRNVSHIFGVIMLAMAIWMLDRVVEHSVTVLLSAILLIISAIYLMQNGVTRGWSEFLKGAGLVVLLYGASLFIGTMSSNASFTTPLAGFGSTQSQAKERSDTLSFRTIHSIEELDKVLKNSGGKQVMVDFYADWCVSCKELELMTFSDENVIKELESFVLVKADITSNSTEEKELTKKYGLFGPPALLFFDGNGRHVPQHTVIGYIPPEKFIPRLKQIKEHI